MKNKDDPKVQRKYNRLRGKERAIIKYLEGVDYNDHDKMQEMVAVQRERAKVGRQLNIGLIQ